MGDEKSDSITISQQSSKPWLFKLGNNGKPAGTLNKSTAYVKAAIIGTFEAIGGFDFFVQWAKNNPTDFYTKILIKLIPEKLQPSDDATLRKVIDFSKLSASEFAVFKALMTKAAPVEATREIEAESQSVQSVDTSTASPVPRTDTISGADVLKGSEEKR